MWILYKVLKSTTYELFDSSQVEKLMEELSTSITSDDSNTRNSNTRKLWYHVEFIFCDVSFCESHSRGKGNLNVGSYFKILVMNLIITYVFRQVSKLHSKMLTSIYRRSELLWSWSPDNVHWAIRRRYQCHIRENKGHQVGWCRNNSRKSSLFDSISPPSSIRRLNDF